MRLLAWAVGLRPLEAVVVGAMVALSSTACVLRILIDRAEIDSTYGRLSLGILLVQDAAVVPLMLLVTLLTTGGTMLSIVWQLDVALASTLLLIATLYVFFTYAAPGLLKLTNLQRNRDLPILLAAGDGHRLGLGRPCVGIESGTGRLRGGGLAGSVTFCGAGPRRYRTGQDDPGDAVLCRGRHVRRRSLVDPQPGSRERPWYWPS